MAQTSKHSIPEALWALGVLGPRAVACFIGNPEVYNNLSPDSILKKYGLVVADLKKSGAELQIETFLCQFSPNLIF